MRARTTLVALLSIGMLASCNQPSRACAPVPASSTFEMSEAAANDTAQAAFLRASSCVHAKAYEFARADDHDVARDAVMGACQTQVQHAQSAAYSSAVLSGVSAPLPPGFTLQAPACENGNAECKPWERKWDNNSPPAGTVVNADGTSASPQHQTGEVLAERVLQDLRNLAALRLTEAKLNNCKA